MPRLIKVKKVRANQKTHTANGLEKKKIGGYKGVSNTIFAPGVENKG